MSRQYSTTLRNDWLSTYESTIGTSPKLRFCTGSPPANCGTAQSGTQLIEMTLPSDWQAAASGGSAAKSGTWSGTVAADGTAGYYRILSSGGTCHEQGLITRAFTISTSASTDANNNVLTFASTTGVSVGMSISGTGIPSGATVLAVTSTTVTMSAPSTAGVSSAVAIYFGDTSGDLWLQNTALTAGQTITIDTRTQTAPGA
jgi:hypothetical protein